ncbi:MAG TPA: 2-oxo-4-hydroxy-4-carboxy-5-ureidoimidazoline decarboxylase [Vicinamibacterales bacterium]|nr:2-oxo-4-hydroxy-4-carboxy-5-ureidoimidazoline decarboxylase [Vicinamibacterales bacterium]
MTIDDLNYLDPAAAEAAFVRCCGSTAWARAMAEARPFASLQAMADAADTIWRSLAPSDWLEAFAAHPKIGERSRTSSWSDREQTGMQSADDDVRRRLASGNATYASRFGYIFIVCAAGKTAAEMLTALETRLSNDPAEELQVAQEEQRKITRLRLAKLIDGPS